MTTDLAELKTVWAADVYKGGKLAARLTRTRDGVEFGYLPEWLDGGGPPVAFTLPVTASVVLRPGGALPAFFTGLLPEGRRLGALRRQIKTSADDELSLLLAVGADAVGDVQVVPEGELPDQVPVRLEVQGGLDQISFRALLEELGIRAERTALPGVQDKVSAAMLNVPLARRGTRCILKLTPPEYPNLVANEFCFLRAAQAAGLDVVRAELVQDRDAVPGLLIQRFDRVPAADGPPTALAVEDACQLLDLPPADKYRVSAEQALGAVSGVCQAPLVASRTLLTQAVFSYLTGNGDAHAKNFSVLQQPSGEWAPSPAYDLPSTQPYGDSTTALTVAGRTSDLGSAHVFSLGTALGLPERASRRVLAQQVERVERWLPMLDDLPFDVGVRRQLIRVVQHRRSRLSGTA